MRSFSYMFALVLVIASVLTGVQSQQAGMDPRAFMQYDSRRLPSFYEKIGNMTEAEYIVKQKNIAPEGVSKQDLYQIFQRVSDSQLEATAPYTLVQQFPYYALRPSDLFARYDVPNNPAQEIADMSPVILTCKIDTNCAFDAGIYPPAQGKHGSLIGTKVAFGIVYIVENIIAIFIPWIIKKHFNKSDFWLTMVSTFCAGILLGASLLELLPLAFRYQNMQLFYNGFPVALCIALVGYLAIFFLDGVLFNNGEGHYPTKAELAAKAKKQQSNTEGAGQQPASGTNDQVTLPVPPQKDSPSSGSAAELSNAKHVAKGKDRLQRPSVLLFGYLLQCVMIFLAIGLQQNIRILILLAVSVFLWQGGEFCAISTQFIKNRCTYFELIMFMIPSAFLPTVFLYAGIGITQINVALQMTFLGFAAGTFLYTALNQILQDELDHVTGHATGWKSWKERYIYFGALNLGIIIIIVAKLIPNDYSTVVTYAYPQA